MTESSRFWNGTSTGDANIAPYDAGTEFAQVLMAVSGAGRTTDKGGVWRDELNLLAASTPGANTARIASGRAQVYGSWYENDSDVDVNVPTPAVATRIDTIVLRKDWTAQTIRIARHAGAEGGAAPALTQSLGTTWEVPLWDVSITIGGTMTFYDRRTFLNEASGGSGENLLTNPGFTIWQRGVGPFTTGWSADRWLHNVSTGTFTVTRESAAVYHTSSYSMKVVTTAPPVSGAIQQWLQITDLYGSPRGGLVTVSAWVRANVASAVRISVSDTVLGHRYSAYHSGNDSWERLTATGYIDPATTRIEFSINFELAVTVYIDSAKLEEGGIATEYREQHPADELARCQRYYETRGKSGELYIAVDATGAQTYGIYVPFSVSKSVTPTITLTGTWSISGVCGAPSVAGGNISITGCLVQTVSSGAGVGYIQSGTLNHLTAEANP